MLLATQVVFNDKTSTAFTIVFIHLNLVLTKIGEIKKAERKLGFPLVLTTTYFTMNFPFIMP